MENTLLVNENLYKIYQIESILVTKYGFRQVMIKSYDSFFQSESWLVNFEDKNYQIIRISFFDCHFDENHIHRINDYLYYLSNKKSKEFKFLDIHINTNPYDEKLEIYDYVNIEENYYAGIDLSNIYPEIYNCVHNSKNPKNEFRKQFGFMKSKLVENRNKLPFLKKHTFLFTFVTIGLCCLMFLLQSILARATDSTSSFLLLGADYKILTLCCKEYYRLFTYAFLHSGFAHIFCNMVSLFSIGRVIEYKFGHKGYLIILITSIICGSLTQGILSDNELCIGMSGGIYGLFVAYLIDAFKSKTIDTNRLVPIVLLNLLLNLNSTTAWMCHLGGAIAGLATYFAIIDKKNYPAIITVCLLVVCLFIKYVSITKITTFYGGTDIAYINALKSLNFDVTDLTNKIVTAYTKYGG